MITIAELVERSKESSKTHKPLPLLKDMRATGIKMSGILIITCVDPRCVPETFFNLQAKEAIVHRNGGGRVRAALQDIAGLDVLVGLDEIAIIHHTDCGALRYTSEGMREQVKIRSGHNCDEVIDGMDFGAIDNLQSSVRHDLELLKESPLVREELANRAQGFIFDISSGELSQVE